MMNNESYPRFYVARICIYNDIVLPYVRSRLVFVCDIDLISEVLNSWFNLLKQPDIQLVTESADEVLTPKCITEATGESLFETMVVNVLAEELSWYRHSECTRCHRAHIHSMLCWSELLLVLH
jgi:hypothetical protein